jgi:hypothetical protein
MDEDQRYERFEDNDFEEGTWIGGEYFYTSAKKRRVQTKDEQLYGYESDASDDDRRRGRGRGGGKKAADYTRPVGFVSSGVVKSTDEKAQDVEAAEHAPAGLGAPSSTPGRPQNGGGGLGFSGASASGGSGGGLGFARAKELHVDPDGAEDADVLPTSFGKRCCSFPSCPCLQPLPSPVTEEAPCDQCRLTQKHACMHALVSSMHRAYLQMRCAQHQGGGRGARAAAARAPAQREGSIHLEWRQRQGARAGRRRHRHL